MKKDVLTITSNYNLDLQQQEIEFVDVPLDYDLKLFIDPLKFQNNSNTIILKMKKLLKLHFTHMLNLIKNNKKYESFLLIDGFSEKYSHGVHLGYSTCKYGKSVGEKKTLSIYKSFSNSKAVRTGKLNDIEESILLIDNISYDTISDIIISLCKEALLDFTIQQAKLHSLDTKPFTIKVLNSNSKWIYKTYDLPYNKSSLNEEIILVPKGIITHKPRLTISRAYSYLWYKLKDYSFKETNLSLAFILNNNLLDKPLLKKEFKEIIPETKESIINFFEDNPDELHSIIDKYKECNSARNNADAQIEEAYEELFFRLTA